MNNSEAHEGESGKIFQTQLFVTRHSKRIDDDDNAQWPNQIEKPYDPPIVDFELPKRTAMDIKGASMEEPLSLLISSPYLRCLQTAAILAKHLDIDEVIIHNGLAELQHHVRRIQKYVWKKTRPADGKIFLLESKNQEGLLRKNSAGIIRQVSKSDQGLPEPMESIEAGIERMRKTIRSIVKEFCVSRKRSTIVVAHGDTLNACLSEFSKQMVYSADNCSWCAFNVLYEEVSLYDSSGIKFIDESELEG